MQLSPRHPAAARSLGAACLCGVLLFGFTAVAWFAAQTKSPAYDEPYHAIAAWVQLRQHDFRIDSEDPPLWLYWAALPNGVQALSADFHGSTWQRMPNEVVKQWYWGVQTLYRTPGNDAARFVSRSRGMMLMWGLVLGAVISVWAWRIGGAVAAIVATTLFCFDPNFLAHSPLMKNDVAFALTMFGLAISLWKAGQNLTFKSILAIALMCIATLTVKFSGMVAVLLVPILMTWRSLSPQPWPVLGRSISSRGKRLIAAMAVTLFAASISYLGIWAVYGFRFRPTPAPNVWLNLQELTDQTRIDAMVIRNHGQPVPGSKPDAELSLTAKAAVFANQHGLLPQAFVAGFLFTYANALVRVSYLCRQISAVGWWWYFPFAILVKTPIVTLLATAGAGVLAIRALLRGRLKNSAVRWTAVCLFLPVGLFLASAMSSNLNIGLRHVLGIYPFVFVSIGWAVSVFWQRHGRKLRLAVIGAGLILAAESLSVFPDYIPYFNIIAANTSGGKMALLGDSNLDWGQDLLSLAKWQRDNPQSKLYLSYFGYADPAYYGIKYTPLPGGYHYDPTPHFPDPYTPSVIAISATNLQGILVDPKLRSFYEFWAKRKPRLILGDSIYLYDYDPASGFQQPR